MIFLVSILEIIVTQHHIDGQTGHQMAGTTLCICGHRDGKKPRIFQATFVHHFFLESISIFTLEWMERFPEEPPSSCFYEGMCSCCKKEMERFSHSIDSSSSIEPNSNSESADSGRSPLSQDLFINSMMLPIDAQSNVADMKVNLDNAQGFFAPHSPFSSHIDGNPDVSLHIPSLHDEYVSFDVQNQPNLLSGYPVCSIRR